MFRSLSASDFDKYRKLMSGMVEAADEAIRMLDYNGAVTSKGSGR